MYDGSEFERPKHSVDGRCRNENSQHLTDAMMLIEAQQSESGHQPSLSSPLAH